MKKLYALVAVLTCALYTHAQVSTYVFSQSQGTYTPITGGTVLETATGLSGAASLDSRVYNLTAGTIPFTFTFNGTGYTGLNVSSNGFITFGATAPSTTLTTAISSTTAYEGTIAAVSRDLNALFNINGLTGDIRYETVGTAPSREFVIQWSNFRPWSTSTSTTTYFHWNFQIRLREDNSIAIVYDFSVVGAPTSSTAQIGLRGASNTDFNNRTAASGVAWTSTSAGTANSNTVAYSSTNLPPSGLTFTWTPSSCFAPTSPTVTNITLTGANISWTAPATGTPTGYEYAITTSPTPPTSGTANATTSASVSNLSAGTLYYLHVRSVCGGSSSNWVSTSFSTLSANDECTSAVALTVASGTTCGTVTAASTVGSTQSLAGCTGTADDDVWFSFTATNVAHIINLQNVVAATGTSTTIVSEVFSGTCASLTSVRCFSGTANTVTGLTVGVTYYVRVYSSLSTSRLNFDICVTTPPTAPANDECAGAITITPEANGASCASSNSATTANALPSLPDPSCTSTSNNDDIWYAFTATSSAYILRFSNMVATTGTATQLGFAVYSGSCGNLTQMHCQATVGTAGAGASVPFGGFLPGTTYYIRMWTGGSANAATFDFCLQEAPPVPSNDDCRGAITITPEAAGTSCAASTSATTVNATQSDDAPSCTSTSNNDDIWYSFTASATAYQVRFSNMVATTGTATQLGIAVYSGNCGTLTQLICQTTIGTAGAGISTAFGGLTIGTTYYIRMWTTNTSNAATFDFCLQEAPVPPANDECSGAIAITPQGLATNCVTSTNATTVNATQSPEATTTCSSTNINDDIWYTFTAGADKMILRFSGMTAVTGTATTLGYYVYSGNCGTLTQVACNSGFGTSGAGANTISGLTPGTTYYLRLFTGSTSNTATFSFCLQNAPTPVNDECANAPVLNVTASGGTCTATQVVTAGASESAQANSCTSTGTDDDVWYRFTTTIAGDYNFSYSGLAAYIGTASTVGMNIYTGNCGGLTEVSGACNTGFGTSGSGSRLVTLAANTTYYLRLYVGSSTNSGVFDFCITAPATAPANDECSGAINITTQAYAASCITGTAAISTGATASAVTETSCVTSNDNDDIWYTFTATSTTQILRFSNLVATAGTATTLGYQLFTGTCGTLTQLTGCSTGFGSAGSGATQMTGLTVGTTYYLRLFSGGTANSATFDFCIQDLPTPPANDECIGAVTVAVNNSSTCTATTQGSTVGATQSMAACTGSGADDDVWFKFVATGSYHKIELSNVAAVSPFGTSTDMVFELFSGICGTLTSIACSDPLTGTFSNLTVGNTYYIRVHTELTTSRVNFDLCISTPAAPVANDDCSGATVLTVGAAATTGTTETAYQSLAASNCSNAISETANDVWYSFVATSNAHNIWVDGSTSYDAVIEAFVSCGAGSMGCVDTAGNDKTDVLTLTGLTVGSTYYVRVYEYGTGAPASSSFTIQVTTAGIAPGTPGSCQTVNAFTVDASNNTKRNTIADAAGKLVADIEPNGNNLGAITTKVYVHNGTVRTDNSGRPYLNRNYEITPAAQPTSPVTVRLYFTAAELAALQAAPGSGVAGIADIGVFKNNEPCSSAIGLLALPITSTTGTMDGDYFVEFQVSSFSSFFIAAKTFSALPVDIKTFSGQRSGSSNLLRWTTTSEQNNRGFDIERSEDGRNFQSIGFVASLAQGGNSATNLSYQLTDQSIRTDKAYYYRLRQVDLDGRSKLSNVILLRGNKVTALTLARLFPNPAQNYLMLSIEAPDKDNVVLDILDMNGRVVMRQSRGVVSGTSTHEMGVTNLASGTYLLRLTSSNGEVTAMRFVKQ